MAKNISVVGKVTELALPIAEKLKVNLWDVRFVKEGSAWFLRIFIDKSPSDGGITMDDCEAMSRAIDPLLDDADMIEQVYYLEVSSAGLGRELKKPEHFKRYVGESVKVKLIRPLNGVREFVGILKSYDDKNIVIDNDGTENTFALSETSSVKANDDNF